MGSILLIIINVNMASFTAIVFFFSFFALIRGRERKREKKGMKFLSVSLVKHAHAHSLVRSFVPSLPRARFQSHPLLYS